MANKKITQLTDIGSSITGTDLLHIVDGIGSNPVNKKVSVDNLFANVPRTSLDITSPLTYQHLLDVVDTSTGTNVNKNVSITDLFKNVPGLLNLSQTPQLTSNGAISTSDVKTLLTLPSNSTVDVIFTLADGTEGQLKFIVMTVKDGSHNGVVTPTNLLGPTSLTFDAVGDSVLLLFTGGKWAIISNNGVTTV
jgi:hypothetical protein